MSGMSLLVLLLNIPGGDIIRLYNAQVLIYLFLTAFALYFGVWLSRGALSPAHAIGMVAFLSLPQDAIAATTWAISLGGVAGGITLIMRKQIRTDQTWQNRINTIAMIVARVTISFYAASQVYIALDGSLPMQLDGWINDDMRTPFALLVYVLVYFTLYVAIYVMETYINGLPVVDVLRNNLSLILVILFLPLPFAIITAELSSGLRQPPEIFSLIGMAVIVLGLHAISRSEQQTRKQLQELMTLSIVTRAMRAHLQPESLLKTIYVQVSELFDTPNFTLLIYDKDCTQVMSSLVIRQNVERMNIIPEELVDYPLINRVILSRVPLFLPDQVSSRAAEMGLNIADDHHILSWMGVPLLIGAGGPGVIIVSSENSQRLFTASDLRLLTIIADSASIAIENAQLFERQSLRVSQLSMLNNVASLLSGTLSPDNVLDTILSSASAVSDANGIALFLFSDDELTRVRTAGLSDHYDIDTPLLLLTEDDVDVPLHQRKPLGIGDIMKEDRAAPVRSSVQYEGYRALIELPLALGDRAVGVLQLFYASVQVITDETLELLRTYATQAAQAVANAQTYATTDEAFQRSVEQLLALAGIGRLLTSTIDLVTICDMVLQHVIDSTHARVGTVALVDEDGSTLQLMSQAVLSDDDVLVDTAAIFAGASQRALRDGQAQRVNDIQQAIEQNVRLMEDTRSQLVVPILRGREVLGIITLESNRVSAFSPEDSHFVAQVANQAVIAIDNARLFQRITEARDRLQVILDTMEEAIVLLDAKGKVALANPRITLLDLMPYDLIDNAIEDLLDNGHGNLLERMGFNDPLVFHKMIASISQENAWAEHPPHLYTIQSQEGVTRYIQRYVIPVLDDSAQTMGVLLVFYDKTDEQELHRAREELTRMIVHDLRSPLTAVTTGLKLLQDYVPEDNSAYNLVQNTTQSSRQAVRKLLGRVDSLLDISKMQSGRLAIERSDVSLAEVINAVRDELRPLSSELDIQIKDELPDDLPLLYVDRDKVERLMLNLLDNALKYSPTESVITVRAYLPGEKSATTDYIRVDVIDNGPGVPDDYKKSLFNSYVQVEGRAAVRRGVGLGLSFCRLVTEAHAGAIWIEDNKPTGSIFSVTLPSVLVQAQSDDVVDQRN